MKKMYAVLLTLCVGIFFAGVNCGSETTEIGWIDGTGGTAISDIVWFDDTSNQNQVWSEKIDDGTATDRTAQKEVTKTTGYAECVVEGIGAQTIWTVYEDSGGYPKPGGTVSEGSATYYTIKSTSN